MPNIAFAPAPRTDPYAGKAGEYLADIITSIGKIGMVRRDRREREEIFDIVSSGGSHDQINKGVVDLANSGNRYAMNLINQARMSEIMKPETERLQDEATLKRTEAMTANTEARTNYWQGGGSQAQKKPLTTTAMKAHQDAMDTHIAQAEKKDIGGKNFTKSNLKKGWVNYKIVSGFDGLPPNQQEQLWQAWNTKLQAKGKKSVTAYGALGGNEYEWDPEDPEIMAVGPNAQQDQSAVEFISTESYAIEQEMTGYIEQLDDDSKAKLQDILDRDDKEEIKRALQKMRNMFGKP